MALSEGFLKGVEDREIHFADGNPPVRLKSIAQALEIPARACHFGFRHFHVVQAHHRVDLNGARLGAFAHHLPVDLAFRRHVDDDVAQEARRATQAPVGGQAPLLGVTLFGGVHRAQVRGTGLDGVLGKESLAEGDLTAAAQALATADRVQINAEAPRRLEKRRADGEVAALAARREYNGGLVLRWISQRCVPRGAGGLGVGPHRQPLRDHGTL